MGPSRQPFEYTWRAVPLDRPPAGAGRHDGHVSETQDAASAPTPPAGWRTGDLDLSAFEQEPSARDLAEAGRTFESESPDARTAGNPQTWVDIVMAVTGLLASLIMLPIWVSVVVSGIAADTTEGMAVFAPVVVIMSVLLWVFVAGAIWGFSRLRTKGGRPLVWWRLNMFARANGLSYRARADASTVTTSLVRGRTRFWFEDRLQPLEAPTDLTVATLVIEGDSGDFSVGERRWGFTELRLDRSMPHIVVETTERTRAESDFGILPGQSFELEGDFPRFARVYADEADRRTALELLTPDVMAAIVDETAGYDLEVRGDRLAIVSPERTEMADPANLARMFRMAAVIGVEARRVSAKRGDGRYVVDFAAGIPPQRMRQRRVSRGAIRGFLISGIVIAVITAAAVVLPALRG